jgi:hypothetical protein
MTPTTKKSPVGARMAAAGRMPFLCVCVPVRLLVVDLTVTLRHCGLIGDVVSQRCWEI